MYILHLPISSRKKITRGTTEISFGLGNNEFLFRAGQYVRITASRLIAKDPRGDYRDFSIASSPYEKGQFKIAIRNSESGFKRSLLEVPLGTEVKVTGPFGNLAFPENGQIPIVFVAGGIGITPFFSMINYILEQKDGRRMTLLFGNKSEEDAPYLKELEILSQKNTNFLLKNRFGLIDKKFIVTNVDNPKSAFWFIAGPPAMVAAANDVLSDIGVASDYIRTEEFVGCEAWRSKYGLSMVGAPEETFVSEELFAETLLESFKKIAAVSKADLNGTIIYANDLFVEVSKYKRDELIGQNHRIVRSGHHPQSFYNSIWETISNGKVWRGEIKDRAKDGTYHWADSTITPVINKRGAIVNYLSVRLPITDRKEAEEALKKRTEELEAEKARLADVEAKDKALLASIGDGLIAMDENGTITYVNPSAEKILGFVSEEFIGKLFYQVWQMKDENGEILPLEKRPIQIALKSKKLVRADSYYVRKDGNKISVAITATPILNEKLFGAIALFRDISREKEIEKIRTDFLSLASHQLRTPLSGTKWLIETMQRKITGPVTEKQKEYLNQVYKINERMIKLVFDMLNVLRLESGAVMINKETISVSDLYEELSVTMEAAAKSKGVILRNALKNHKMVLVESDITTLRTILECFVSNAINYSESGQEATFDLKEESTALVFLVKDSGIGIPKEEQKRIFERFYRASNAKIVKPDGTGLGLYIASMLAEKIGAEILFDSEEGKGSTFYLRIPKTSHGENKVENNKTAKKS